MGSPSNSQDNSKQWSTFIRKCQQERVATGRFEEFAKLLTKKAQVSGQNIAQLILATQQGRAAIDPLVVSYIKCLLRLRIVLGYELLKALLQVSYTKAKALKDGPNASDGAKEMQSYVSTELEGLIINALTLLCASNELIKSSSETTKTFIALSEWMNTMIELDHQAMMREVSEGIQTSDPQIAATREALGRFTVALVETPRVIADVESSVPSDVVKQFAKSLPGFTSSLAAASMQLSNRLDIFQQSHEAFRQPHSSGFNGEANDTGVDVGEIQVGNIVDRPITHTRAYLAVYFDSLLYGVPQVNDNTVLAHLQSRFKGDNESLIVSSIAGAFDLLTMASARGDSTDRLFLNRAFLVNKIPLLIHGAMSMNYHSFMPLNLPVLISQAFSRLEANDMNSLNSGLGIEINSEIISIARKDFLLACGLNGLISEEDVKHLAQDTSIKVVPPGNRANRTTLIEECRSNPQKLEQMVKSLETAKGDAGEYVAALVQMVANLCSSQDTMTLKTLCLLLCPKPHAIDMLFLFSNPESILRPICQALEEWKYDDDQGEYQPVYEEFSGCFLFILVCVHRYNLSTAHLELQPDSAFLSWALDLGQATKPVQKPTSEQVKQLAGWAKALFELEAISDDVMSICPPQDFYRLVPTIFAQTFLARRLDILSIKALDSGTELLLVPFLLPSMILGVHYLAEQAWRHQDSSKIIMPFLAKLIRPAAKSGEPLALQNAVVAVLKPQLTGILHGIRSADSVKQEDMESLLELLNQTEAYSRNAESLPKNFASSIAGPGSGVLMYYRTFFDSLCSWSMPAGMMSSVPTYSYECLQAALKLCGAAKVLNATIEALTSYSETNIIDIALDVATAIICAQSTFHSTTSVTVHPSELYLRQALQLARDDAAKTIIKEPVKGELIVLLHRRVESQLSAMPMTNMQQMDMQNVNMGLDMGIGATNVNMGMNLNMEMDMINIDSLNVDQNNPQMEVSTQDISSIDFASTDNQQMGMSDSQFSLALDTSFANQANGATNEGQDDDDEARRTSVEDIWSGLGLDDGMDFT